MPTTFTTQAIEESTFIVTVDFTDENGTALVPNSGLNWTLVDANGAIVNSRSAVAVSPAASINIVLSGDDLAISEAADNVRFLLIAGTYNSSLGSNLPLKDQCRFSIANLVAVT